MKSRTSTLAAVAAAVLFGITGCTVGPDFVRPTVQSPANWRIDYPKAAEVANTRWWEQFGDPVLNQLIETALRDNLDVRVAAARIDQFLGALRTTDSQAYPQLGYGAGATRTRASREGVTPIPDPFNNYFTVYQGSLNANWQIDLFGRVRRMSEAAQAQVYASEQAQRGVVLTLVTGVATGYITLRALDRQLEIAKSTAANFGETARIFDLRFRKGLVSQTEVSQIRSQYQQALTAIPTFEQQIAALENQLSILLGRDPAPIPRGRSIDQLVVPLIPAGLPSDLLQRRPDILAAEQNLVAANASIGVARSLYYPNISLTGALGSTSTSFGDFLTGPASTWSVVAGLTGPIFTFGAIEGQVRSAEAQKAQAELVYQQTVLGAFRDANNALVGTQKSAEGVDFQRERVRQLREFARLSRLKFENGLVGYLEVLISDNELFAAELNFVNLQAARYTQAVNVYQAMGGGWVDVADGLTPRPVGMAPRRATP
ncbi:efflux transporter outer membrane subunit [Variovorax sp. J22P168]|uniref:efflux transporter outer membrane subunit n=1 Tax=Variovorax jilinensis TaxID=3053513 RepID=UPI002574BD2A|nr:efflux transporter outer membrane subunit [Variovorax sp. J22P168]MDM0011304.1 efflux transporter outer membrane subunit [Variovorax sp. J22P168]